MIQGLTVDSCLTCGIPITGELYELVSEGGLDGCLKHIQSGFSVINISCLHYSRLSQE